MLTAAERVLAQPDANDPIGLRDRAILETLYSTGIRRMEVIHLPGMNVRAIAWLPSSGPARPTIAGSRFDEINSTPNCRHSTDAADSQNAATLSSD